jgi:hypothetical protein
VTAPDAMVEKCPFVSKTPSGILIPCSGHMHTHCGSPHCTWWKCSEYPRIHVLNPATGHMMGDSS